MTGSNTPYDQPTENGIAIRPIFRDTNGRVGPGREESVG